MNKKKFSINEICNRKIKNCPRFCKQASSNCDRLKEWLKFHNPELLHPDRNEHYAYWSNEIDLIIDDGVFDSK